MKRRHLLSLFPTPLLAAEPSPAPTTSIPVRRIGTGVLLTGSLGEPLGKIVALSGTFVSVKRSPVAERVSG